MNIGLNGLKEADIGNREGCQIERIAMTLRRINSFSSIGNAGGACTIITHLLALSVPSRTSAGAREQAECLATDPGRGQCPAPAAPPTASRYRALGFRLAPS